MQDVDQFEACVFCLSHQTKKIDIKFFLVKTDLNWKLLDIMSYILIIYRNTIKKSGTLRFEQNIHVQWQVSEGL